MENKILIIDIETTGFLKQGGKIVEIGIIELDIKNGDSRIIFDEICHERPITKEHVDKSWIVQNGYMTTEEIQHSKQLSEFATEIQGIINLYSNGSTAYNNVFDFGFLEDRGFHFPKKLPCPMILSTNICKIPKSKGMGYKWPKVEEAYKHFFPESDYTELHRGADDAIHEAEIVFKLIEMDVFKVEIIREIKLKEKFPSINDLKK